MKNTSFTAQSTTTHNCCIVYQKHYIHESDHMVSIISMKCTRYTGNLKQTSVKHKLLKTLNNVIYILCNSNMSTTYSYCIIMFVPDEGSY